MTTTGSGRADSAFGQFPPQASPRRDELAALPWAYRTRSFAALDWRFTVEVSNGPLGELIDDALAGLATHEAPEHVYSMIAVEEGRGGIGVLFIDGVRINWTTDPPILLQMLLWHINLSVIESSDRWVLLHAAAVAQDGRAVVLSAPMENGKTTTAAGLVRAGLQYLTDEAVALDPDTLVITPFAKPLSIEQGSWEVLADMRPVVPPQLAAYLSNQWQVPPHRIRPGAIAPGAEPALVVMPRYVEGSRSELVEVSRATALTALIDQCFTFSRHPRRDFDTLAALVARTRCYRLTVGNLDEAAALVRQALTGG